MYNSFFHKLRSFCIDFIIFIIPLFVLLHFFPLIFRLIIPFILAFFLYIPAKPINKFLLNLHFSPFLASFFSLLLVAFVFCGGAWLLFSTLLRELQDFSDKLSDIYITASQTLRSISEKISSYGVLILKRSSPALLSSQFSESFISQFSEMIASFTASLLGYAKNLFGIFIIVFTAFLTSFFMLKDKNLITSFLHKALGKTMYGRCLRAKERIFKIICSYLKAEFYLCSIIFIVLLIGLLILRVKYAVLIAFVTAITDAVPILGAGTVLIPWAIFCILSKNTVLGWGLVSLYGVCLLTRQICEPKIVGKKLGIHPLVSIISIYTGMQLFGIAGIIIGPVCAVFIKSLLFVKFSN